MKVADPSALTRIVGGTWLADAASWPELPDDLSFSIDSRTVRPGDVFIAIRGDRHDGHLFATDATRAGSPILIESEHDHSAYELKETFSETDGGGWLYELRLAPTLDGVQRALSSGRTPPSVRIVVPRGLPLELDVNVPRGRSELELGGLSLSSVEVEYGGGEHVLSFGEPTAAPMSALVVESHRGHVRLGGIGNASSTEEIERPSAPASSIPATFT